MLWPWKTKIYLLAIASCGFGLQQVRHDASFQPDHVLRVGEELKTVACRTKLTAVVNGEFKMSENQSLSMQVSAILGSPLTVEWIGTTPGPAIYLSEGKTSWVRVYNDFASDNLTIHWHGLSQSVAPYSDGTPQASQWPIKAGHYFDYELHPNVGEAGTYFYHSHVDFQAVSVAGPLIVEENGRPRYEYDEERTIFISEVFNKTDQMIVNGLSTPKANFSWPGEEASFLVNGKNYRSLGAEKTETSRPWSDPAPATNETCGPEVIKVKPNQSYRIRTIGSIALSPLAYAFENHDIITMIAADSRYTQPVETSLIQLGSGQRYDYILHTKTDEELQQLGKSLFWIQLETRYREQNNTFYAMLQYETEDAANTTIPSSPPTEKPIEIPYSLQNWLEYELEPLEDNDFPTADEVTRQVFLTSSQLIRNSGYFWTVNNRTWTEDDERQDDKPFNDTSPSDDAPYLVQIYKEGNSAIPNYEDAVQNHGGWDPRLNVYAAKVGEVIDIILINEPNGFDGGFDAHPWHIHGDHIYDLGSGEGNFNATENEIRLQGYRPVMRDTTFLFKYTNGDDAAHAYTAQGWRAWRLRVTNPGVWMFHCHILQHMVMGMQSVMVMGNASQITRGVSPDLVEGYLTYGGNAYGNSTYDPLVTHFFNA